MAGMTHKNPWFLITHDEIEEIRILMQHLRDPAGPSPNQIQDIDDLLRHVRDRQP